MPPDIEDVTRTRSPSRLQEQRVVCTPREIDSYVVVGVIGYMKLMSVKFTNSLIVNKVHNTYIIHSSFPQSILTIAGA